MQRDCWAKSPRVFSAFQALPTGSTGISKAGTRLTSSTGNSFSTMKSAQVTLFADLYEQVENRYENDFLLKVNDIWQQQVDALESWHGEPVSHQRDFFKTFIQPLRQKGVKAVVIISDALRYEIGQDYCH